MKEAFSAISNIAVIALYVYMFLKYRQGVSIFTLAKSPILIFVQALKMVESIVTGNFGLAIMGAISIILILIYRSVDDT